jgi:hypothetical protein
VRSDALVDPGEAGDATSDPCRSVSIEAMPVATDKDRSFAAFADRQVDGAGVRTRADPEAVVVEPEPDRVCVRANWSGYA